MINHLLVALLFAALAVVTLIDVGTAGAVVIGLAATPIVLLRLHRHDSRAI